MSVVDVAESMSCVTMPSQPSSCLCAKQPVERPVQQKLKPLYLGQIEVVSADFWTDRFLWSSSFQEESMSKPHAY
jgi:hypothetical protein